MTPGRRRDLLREDRDEEQQAAAARAVLQDSTLSIDPTLLAGADDEGNVPRPHRGHRARTTREAGA